MSDALRFTIRFSGDSANVESLDDRDRVRTILDDPAAAGVGMDEDEAMALALEAQAAARHGR